MGESGETERGVNNVRREVRQEMSGKASNEWEDGRSQHAQTETERE